MAGPELTPFILPRRWTFETLKNCVQDYINRKRGGIVKQLYYKRCRGKNVVRIDNDSDISALIDEYPLRYPSGKKTAGKCIMYLAADVEGKGKPVAMARLYFGD